MARGAPVVGRAEQLPDRLEHAVDVRVLHDDRCHVGVTPAPAASVLEVEDLGLVPRSPAVGPERLDAARGSTPAETSTRPRPAPRDMCTASTSAVAPSYREALETSSPVSSQIIDWNSNSDLEHAL